MMMMLMKFGRREIGDIMRCLPYTARRPLKGPKNAVFVPGDFDLQFRPARDQTRLPCEFGANVFSGSTNGLMAYLCQ